MKRGLAPVATRRATTPSDAAYDDDGNGDQQPAEVLSRIQRSQAETLKSLKRAQRETNQTIEVGEDTTRRLAHQSDTINRIDGTLDKTEYELKVADRILKGMTGIGGAIASWFTSAPKAPPPQMPHARDLDASPSSASSGKKTPPPASSSTQPSSRRGDFIPITSAKGGASGSKSSTASGAVDSQEAAAAQQRSEYDVAIDQGLDALMRDLTVIKGQAKLHSEVIDEQNRRLDEISKKTDRVDDHMRRNQRKIKNLM